MYTSTTSMYVLSRTEGNASVTYNDLQTSTQLTQDYMELVSSRPVLEQVIAVLNLDMTTEELEKFHYNRKYSREPYSDDRRGK